MGVTSRPRQRNTDDAVGRKGLTIRSSRRCSDLNGDSASVCKVEHLIHHSSYLVNGNELALFYSGGTLRFRRS